MQTEMLGFIVGLLDGAGISHMVAGSFASTFHGEPRMTRDIDIVIDPTVETLDDFVSQIDRERFYVGDAPGALENRDMFNVVDSMSGWKVDLIIRKDRPFSVEEFGRRLRATIDGVGLFVASPEDTVLAKLEWGAESGSERQIQDVVAVLRMQDLDGAYLARWAAELGVEAHLARARRLARG